MRPLMILLFCLGLLPAAFAQAPATPAPPPAAEARRLLDLLQDEARRAELMRTLEALAAAGQATAPLAPATPPADGAVLPAPAAPGGAAPAPSQPAAPQPVPAEAPLLAPNTLGGQVLTGASHYLSWLSDQVVLTVRTITDLPGLVEWLSAQARDPVTHARIADASWKLALSLGFGVLAERLAARALAGPRRKLDQTTPGPMRGWARLRWMPLLLGRLLLDLFPLAAFGFAAYGLIPLLQPLPTTELILLTAAHAYLGVRVVMALGRLLFSPASARLRLVPCDDAAAAYAMLWLHRVAAVLITGNAIAEAGLLFGLPWGVYDAIRRLVLLVVSVFLGIIVLHNRAAVARWLRAPELRPGDQPNRARLTARRFRDGLAEIWHILAILYLLALWMVWALQIEDGFTRLLRTSALTLVVLAAARLLDMLLRRLAGRLFRAANELAGRHPGLESRAGRYAPLLKGLLSIVMTVLTLMTLLEVWGIAAFGWFAPGALGSRLLGSGLSFGLTVLLALLLWEIANAALQRHIDRLSRDAEAARSARVRTLVPMLRTTLLVVILLFVGFTLLSEIGVNVAPLLAGAGVIGLALGFGSQKLVQDVITGIFLLFEDAMAVGDVVNLGGKAGVVEQLSIRSIKLRDLDGSLHIIPFSTVNSVTNMTRDFSFAVLDIQVAYREDIDRVVEVLTGICAEMRTEARWGLVIRDEMEVLGVDKLMPDGPVIRVRIKTEPIKRWEVMREANRRIKRRFDELGIEIPAHRQRLMFEEAAANPLRPASPARQG
ncbi:mechanosensitive ion channel domain-containing protein [Teichococcus oryzae]|uniref:Mechanosensitive ion channel n=1 Tax=Teichococcus oryzae TaxID=1608942 RepID=A0A5B2TJR8_9PROT|nr:mechanosensitive ion channel domain-containing protein [Pseudoroseomonas oryzae]KAA2214235.1 mechanosensitive ion channel [Pseudoroseomonas oryzae]